MRCDDESRNQRETERESGYENVTLQALWIETGPQVEECEWQF